jgi:predicted hexulose-6-phosphate isomerase
MFSLQKNPVGVYEKAFPEEYSWEHILVSARQAGYDFVEMSIDESTRRLDRLKWQPSERAALRQAIHNTGIPIWGMGISAHRKFPMGSASAVLRQQGLDILYQSIELAVDLGVRVIQVMGYDAFYEPSNADTEARYLEGLSTGVRWASAAGVLLALENGDSELVNSATKIMRIVKLINSPWLQAYPDIGNMTAFGYDPLEQLPQTNGHLAGVHVKDTRKGELRGVALGEGIVQFEAVFQLLARLGYSGPLVMEMWSGMGKNNDPIDSVTNARQKLSQWIAKAWSNTQKDS